MYNMADNTRTGLHGLTNKSIKKAFEKVKTEGLPEEWELRLLTDDLKDAAILFIKTYFVPHEPLVTLFDAQWDEDAEQYWRAVFDQGITLLLTNKTNGEIIAIRGIEIVRKTNRIDTENVPDEHLRSLLDYINYCDDQAKFFEFYGTDEAIHFSGLAVSEPYRRRGIATIILKSAVDFVECLGLDCVHIKGEASSNYSKKIYEKLDFEAIYEQVYEDYSANVKQIMHEIGEHKTYKIYGKCIKGLK